MAVRSRARAALVPRATAPERFVPFGNSGYVVLYQYDGSQVVILALAIDTRNGSQDLREVKRTPRYGFSSSLKAAASGDGRDCLIASISSSVKSSMPSTSRSRRFKRWYSSTEIITVRSRPLRVTITGRVNTMS